MRQSRAPRTSSAKRDGFAGLALVFFATFFSGTADAASAGRVGEELDHRMQWIRANIGGWTLQDANMREALPYLEAYHGNIEDRLRTGDIVGASTEIMGFMDVARAALSSAAGQAGSIVGAAAQGVQAAGPMAVSGYATSHADVNVATCKYIFGEEPVTFFQSFREWRIHPYAICTQDAAKTFRLLLIQRKIRTVDELGRYLHVN